MDGSTEHTTFTHAQHIAQRAREFARDTAVSVPIPGRGQTLARWSALFCVARESLALVKLVEAHLDAVAIITECDSDSLIERGQLWAVWAADPPHQRVRVRIDGSDVRLTGVKPWCSGAHGVSHALVVCHDGSQDRLAAVAMDRQGILVESSTWKNAGMRDADTCAVHFDNAKAILIGAPDSYVARPGFWHGAMGIAACWLGGAVAVADTLRRAAAREDPHLFAHLGVIDASIRAAQAFLRDAARIIDAEPRGDTQSLALAVRATIERTVDDVIHAVGRALGAAPLCCDAEHAQRVADLAVFVRQSHAEHDLEMLGRLCVKENETAWIP